MATTAAAAPVEAWSAAPPRSVKKASAAQHHAAVIAVFQVKCALPTPVAHPTASVSSVEATGVAESAAHVLLPRSALKMILGTAGVVRIHVSGLVVNQLKNAI